MPDGQRPPPPLHAPYNFVPLSQHVRTDWGPAPSHDRPYRDGLCGTLAIRLTADTPLLVSGSDETAADGAAGASAAKRFFRLPDGTPAIPGASLRGMIRNLVEIIAFGKFRQVDDRRFGLRDLTAATRLDYGGRFTETVGSRRYRPRSRAGWLEKNPGGGWQITPCDFARIDQSQFVHLSPAFAEALDALKRRREQDERGADRIYKAWEAAMGPLTALPFEVETAETPHRHSPGELVYREAFVPGHARPGAHTATQQCRLVFTGQPSPRKHLEFVFLDGAAGPALPVPPAAWRGFLEVHEGQEKESPTWDFWRGRHRRGEAARIPVFFLEDGGGGVAALGLAMMFKLAQETSTHDMIRAMAPAHLDSATLDLAERLFGRVEAEGDKSLKGRVDFGLARLVGGAPPELSHTAILGAPKPSYFPAYVRQLDLAEGDGGALASRTDRSKPEYAQYRTYMRYNGKAEALRGWKRYPARGPGAHAPPPLNAAQAKNPKTHVRLCPLRRDGGLVFEGLVHFHNLRPEEVGALVWTLEWGGDAALRHGLGMGKPFGWGQVAIRLLPEHPRHGLRANRPGAPPPSLEDCRRRFVEGMEAWLRGEGVAEGWAASPQLRRLKAMADPRNARFNPPLRHMTLDPDKGPQGNDFLTAKKQGLVLREYWDAADQAAFDAWRDGRGEAPVRRPQDKQIKGFASSGGGGAAASRPAAAQAGRRPPSGRLLRRGERVAVIEDGFEGEVVEDQASPEAPVRVRLDGGEVEQFSPDELGPAG